MTPEMQFSFHFIPVAHSYFSTFDCLESFPNFCELFSFHPHEYSGQVDTNKLNPDFVFKLDPKLAGGLYADFLKSGILYALQGLHSVPSWMYQTTLLCCGQWMSSSCGFNFKLNSIVVLGKCSIWVHITLCCKCLSGGVMLTGKLDISAHFRFLEVGDVEPSS